MPIPVFGCNAWTSHQALPTWGGHWPHFQSQIIETILQKGMQLRHCADTIGLSHRKESFTEPCLLFSWALVRGSSHQTANTPIKEFDCTAGVWSERKNERRGKGKRRLGDEKVSGKRWTKREEEEEKRTRSKRQRGLKTKRKIHLA